RPLRPGRPSTGRAPRLRRASFARASTDYREPRKTQRARFCYVSPRGSTKKDPRDDQAVDGFRTDARAGRGARAGAISAAAAADADRTVRRRLGRLRDGEKGLPGATQRRRPGLRLDGFLVRRLWRLPGEPLSFRRA